MKRSSNGKKTPQLKEDQPRRRKLYPLQANTETDGDTTVINNIGSKKTVEGKINGKVEQPSQTDSARSQVTACIDAIVSSSSSSKVEAESESSKGQQTRNVLPSQRKSARLQAKADGDAAIGGPSKNDAAGGGRSSSDVTSVGSSRTAPPNTNTSVNLGASTSQSGVVNDVKGLGRSLGGKAGMDTSANLLASSDDASDDGSELDRHCDVGDCPCEDCFSGITHNTVLREEVRHELMKKTRNWQKIKRSLSRQDEDGNEHFHTIDILIEHAMKDDSKGKVWRFLASLFSSRPPCNQRRVFYAMSTTLKDEDWPKFFKVLFNTDDELWVNVLRHSFYFIRYDILKETIVGAEKLYRDFIRGAEKPKFKSSYDYLATLCRKTVDAFYGSMRPEYKQNMREALEGDSRDACVVFSLHLAQSEGDWQCISDILKSGKLQSLGDDSALALLKETFSPDLESVKFECAARVLQHLLMTGEEGAITQCMGWHKDTFIRKDGDKPGGTLSKDPEKNKCKEKFVEISKANSLFAAGALMCLCTSCREEAVKLLEQETNETAWLTVSKRL